MALSRRFREQVREAHVLVPYAVEGGVKVSPSYDTDDYRRQLAAWFGELELPWTWHALSPQDADSMLDELSARTRGQGCVFLNLCDGCDQDGYPGLSVVHALERLRLPFSGADSRFYDVTTCKLRSKSLLRAHDVPTPPWLVVAEPDRDLRRAAETIGFPLFLKPSISAGSYGLSERSVLVDIAAGLEQFARLSRMRAAGTVMGDIFVESFIRGREFTGLVIGDRAAGVRAYPVVERLITELLEPDKRFLSYERYWEKYAEEAPVPGGEPLYRYASVPGALGERLAGLCRDAYLALEGCGYARVDLRMDAEGRAFVLEVNSNCGLSDDGLTSVSHILSLTGRRASEMLAEILEDAWNRHRRRRAGQAAHPGGPELP